MIAVMWNSSLADEQNEQAEQIFEFLKKLLVPKVFKGKIPVPLITKLTMECNVSGSTMVNWHLAGAYSEQDATTKSWFSLRGAHALISAYVEEKLLVHVALLRLESDPIAPPMTALVSGQGGADNPSGKANSDIARHWFDIDKSHWFDIDKMKRGTRGKHLVSAVKGFLFSPKDPHKKDVIGMRPMPDLKVCVSLHGCVNRHC